MSSLTDWLDDRPLLGSGLKGLVGGTVYAGTGYLASGTVPTAGAAAFGVAFAVLSFVFARRRD